MSKFSLPALVAVALIAGACSNGYGSTGGSPSTPAASLSPGLVTPPAGRTVTVKQFDYRFDPVHAYMTSAQGLTITNDGSVVHNLTIKGTSVSVDVQPGQTVHLTIASTVQPGFYTIYCKYHESRGMIGALTIVAPTPSP
jgi:plastocyanin